MSDTSLGKVLDKAGLLYFWQKLKEKFVQSDWNQNDDTQLDYVKNRPCYEYQALGDTLSWDGVTYSVSTSVGSLVLAKVSDKVLTASECGNGVSFVRTAVDGSTETVNFSGSEAAACFQADGLGAFQSYVIVVPTANYNFQGLTFPEPGIYLQGDVTGDIWVSSFTVIGVTDFLGTYYKTIEDKYLNGRLITPGNGSHAEVFNGLDPDAASGSAAHAEGYSTHANGNYSHAQNIGCSANGYASHAEGQSTKASGSNSHAEGYYTIAGSENQHVQGKFNVEDTAKRYAHIVGNGADGSNRKNAHTIDWDGNAWYSGDVYTGGTSQDDAKKLATEEYVDAATSGGGHNYIASTTDITAGVTALEDGQFYYVYE